MLLEKEAELLEKEQTVMVLREEVRWGCWGCWGCWGRWVLCVHVDARVRACACPCWGSFSLPAQLPPSCRAVPGSRLAALHCSWRLRRSCGCC